MKYKRIVGDTFSLIAGYQDDAFDAVITDPMYDYDDEKKLWLLNQCLRVSKGAVVLYSPPENPYPKINKHDQFVYWCKPHLPKIVSKTLSRNVEVIQIYNKNENGTDSGEIRGAYNSNLFNPNYSNWWTDIIVTKKDHKFKKPLVQIERLVRMFSNENDLIGDFFAGSFTVEQACRNLGRNCISIEWSEEYHGK